MRPGIVQTFSALLGESVTEGHPARDVLHRALRRRCGRAWRRCCAPSTATGCRTASLRSAPAPLLVAVMDGLQYQWLLDPESVDMPGAFRDFLALLGEAS